MKIIPQFSLLATYLIYLFIFLDLGLERDLYSLSPRFFFLSHFTHVWFQTFPTLLEAL